MENPEICTYESTHPSSALHMENPVVRTYLVRTYASNAPYMENRVGERSVWGEEEGGFWLLHALLSVGGEAGMGAY